MDYKLIDTHAHLTCDRLYGKIEQIIQHAKDENFSRILVVCTSVEEFYRAKEYKKKEAMIDIALGFHPGDIENIGEQDYEVLKQSILDKDIIAVGEIGLDYHYQPMDMVKQKEMFIRQIHLANEHKMPILIHMRDATKDTLDILDEHCETKFLMHCFSGSADTASIVVGMGGYISLAGPITFKNAKGLLEVPKVVPINRLFVESDCPFLTPHPFRGKENEPFYVRYTFDKVAELKGEIPKELAQQMEENYQEFFGV